MPDLAVQAIGYLLLALVVVGYLRWEWNGSEQDRKRRIELEDQRARFRQATK